MQYGGCENCGERDYCIDFASGTSTCVACGCVDRDGTVMVVALGYSETHGENGERDVDAPEEEPLERAVFVESVEDTIARQPRGKYRGIANKLRDREKWRLGNSAPYKRETYFSERVSQWRHNEPDICLEDTRAINRMFQRFTCQGGLRHDTVRWDGYVTGEGQFKLVRPMTKEDCRTLLASCDAYQSHAAPRFVKKYLVSTVFFVVRHNNARRCVRARLPIRVTVFATGVDVQRLPAQVS